MRVLKSNVLGRSLQHVLILGILTYHACFRYAYYYQRGQERARARGESHTRQVAKRAVVPSLVIVAPMSEKKNRLYRREYTQSFNNQTCFFT